MGKKKQQRRLARKKMKEDDARQLREKDEMDLAATENERRQEADVEEILTAVEALDLERNKKQVLEDFGLLRDCPYCLDELPPFHFSLSDRRLKPCCGKWVCISCDDEKSRKATELSERAENEKEVALVLQSQSLVNNCPFCRAPMFEVQESKDQEIVHVPLHERHLLMNVERGHAWAEYQLGWCHLWGCNVASPSHEFGKELLFAAAKKGYPLAVRELSAHVSGTSGISVFSRSLSNASRLHEAYEQFL